MLRLGLGIGLGTLLSRRLSLENIRSLFSKFLLSTTQGSIQEVVIQSFPPVVKDVDYTVDLQSDTLILNEASSLLNTCTTFNITTNKTQVVQLDLSPFTGITDVNISGYTNLKQLTLPSSPSLGSINIINPSLTSLDAPLLYYPGLNNNFIIDAPITTPTGKINAIDSAIISLATNLSTSQTYPFFRYRLNYKDVKRSEASDDYIGLAFSKLSFSVTDLEIDAHVLSLSSPDTYVSSTPLCSAYTILSPISSVLGQGVYSYSSTRQATDPVTWHRGLTAEFIKSDTTINNRDTFSNASNYHIVYNRDMRAWTVVGPNIDSTNIWLSAREAIGTWGDPPAGKWDGKAYTLAGWNRNPSQFGTVWFQETSVSPSSRFLFNGFRYTGEYGGAQLRTHTIPLSGYRANLFRPGLDFSGICWPRGTFSGSGRGYMISPIHYVFNNHFQVSTSIALYQKDGSIINTTSLSSAVVRGTDLRVGIVDTPSPTFYKVCNNRAPANILRTKNDFRKFIYGPLPNGKVSAAVPSSKLNNIQNYSSWLYYIEQSGAVSYTIPYSEWMSEALVGGDSSTAHWFIDENNELVLLGLTMFPNNSGPVVGNQYLTQMNEIMTSLSNQFNTTVYEATVYNF